MIINQKELENEIEKGDISPEYVIIRISDNCELAAKMFDVLEDSTFVILKDTYEISIDEEFDVWFTPYSVFTTDRYILFNIFNSQSFYNMNDSIIESYNEMIYEKTNENEKEILMEESQEDSNNIISISKFHKK